MHLVLYKSNEKEIFEFFLELSVSDDDKRCYACKDVDDECLAPCHWTQRCYVKAKHANATSSFFLYLHNYQIKLLI